MKEIKIKAVVINDYQSFVGDNYFEFDDNFNLVSGFNGVGKTTLLSAIMWCLTGNDYLDRNKFNIKPKIDGVTNENASPYVCIHLEVNHEPIKIIRIFKDGKSTIRVNDLPIGTLKAYEEFVQKKLGLNLQEIKLLMNPNHTQSLTWQELRDLIMKNFANVDDDELLVKNKYKPIAPNVKAIGIVNFNNGVKKQLADIKYKDIPTIKGRIEQQELAIKEIGSLGRSLKELNASKKLYEEKIEHYNMQVSENEKRQNIIQQNREKLAKFFNDLSVVKKEQDNDMNQIKKLNDKIGEVCNYKMYVQKIKDENSKEIYLLEKENSNKNNSITVFKDKIKSLKEEIEHLRAIKGSYEGVCPYCGQLLPKELKERDKAKNDLKIDDDISRLTKDINYNEVMLDEYVNKVKENEKKIVELKEEISKSKNAKPSEAYKENPQYILLDSQRQELKANIEKRKPIIEKLTKSYDKQLAFCNKLPKAEELGSITQMTDELRNINEKLFKLNNLKSEEKKLEELKQTYDDLCKKLTKCQLIVDLCGDFMKEKAEITKKQLGKYFKEVHFITEELQKNGETKECFKLALDEKPYEMLSTGEKVKVGLDLVCGLQKLQETKITILVDQLGELSKLDDDIEQQIIGCKTMQMLNAKEKAKDEDMYNKYMSAYSKINITKGR